MLTLFRSIFKFKFRHLKQSFPYRKASSKGIPGVWSGHPSTPRQKGIPGVGAKIYFILSFFAKFYLQSIIGMILRRKIEA
jgi:hypothetical protein